MVENHPSSLKVVLIGDCGVGKSSILSTLQGEEYSSFYMQTKNREIQSHEIVLKNGTRQKLQIWDLPGSDDARTYTAHSMHDVKGVIIVFDVCNEASYMNVQNWIKTLNTYVENAAESVVIIIAANKIDKVQARKVRPEQVQQLAHQHNVNFIEVSAKNAKTIKELFAQLASGLDEKARSQDQVNPQPESEEKSEVPGKKDSRLFSNCILL